MLKKKYIYTLLITFLFIIYYINKVEVNKNAIIEIYDENNEEISLILNNNKTSKTSLERLDDKYINIILSIEDKSFYKHSGIDVKRILYCSYSNIFNNTSYGASTITQQLIKNVYLNNEKSISRKIKEIILAKKLEKKLSKNEILELYLSCLYFGNNIYGINNACSYYYSKNLENITIKELISFVALWNSPSIYSANIDKWNSKKNKIAKELLENNIINYIEYLEATKYISLKINKEYTSSNRLYYIDHVIEEMKSLNINEKFYNPIKIYTKYNKNNEALIPTKKINVCSISINKDGYITSLIGNSSYFDSEYNIATKGKRDIGSTIKPLLYYEALKCGINNTYVSEPYTFIYNNENVTITNSSGIYYGKIAMREALAVSDNIYAMKTHLYLGTNTLKNHLKKYGIDAKSIPSLALGSVGLSLLDLTKIYFQFFQNGYYAEPICIYKISIRNNTFYKPKLKIINDVLLCQKIKELLEAPFDTTISHATCSSISKYLEMKCYGKSGLTDYDSYMIGFSDKTLVACWCGDINNEPLIEYEYKKLPKEYFVKLMNLVTLQ